MLNKSTLAAVAICLAVGFPALGADNEEPDRRVYAVRGGVELQAHVFQPTADAPRPAPAIVIAHGGGWAMGEPSWGYGRARHFASLGIVSICVQYRLSDQETITPLEAMDDVAAAVRWTRTNSDELGIDPGRVGGYGWSAGGHLLASAAIFAKDGEVSAVPDALIFTSPALSLESDGWFKKILLGRVEPSEVSPAAHVRAGLPPVLIFQGRTDTVTPARGARRFCDAMVEHGNSWELKIYDDVGHLLTPSDQPDDGWPNPDPEAVADRQVRIEAFLESIGFVPPETN